jgi:hypothetical protein
MTSVIPNTTAFAFPLVIDKLQDKPKLIALGIKMSVDGLSGGIAAFSGIAENIYALSGIKITSSAHPPTAAIGMPYSGKITATTNNPPVKWTLRPENTWLTVTTNTNKTDGDLSGIPDTTGTTLFTALAADNWYPPFRGEMFWTVTVGPCPAAAMAVAGGSGQQAKVHTTFGQRLVVKLTGATGTPVPGVSVHFSAPDVDTSGTFDDGSGPKTDAYVLTDDQGLATAPAFTAGRGAGTYMAAAEVRGAGLTANFTLTNTTA